MQLPNYRSGARIVTASPLSGKLAYGLAGLFVLDRLLKMAAVVHFFGRKGPPAPDRWPGVTLLQPITRGASNLAATLDARAALDYPGHIEHVLVCDEEDAEYRAICRDWLLRHPALDAQIVPVQSEGGTALKTVKLQEGLRHAHAEVVCCVDDDIVLRPDALSVMLPYLFTTGAGAVFGLACYTDWSNLPSSLMSAFVNSNALLSYIPVTYLTQPFTITGHIFAVRRDTLQQVGGFAGLERNIGDDHELARRVRGLGLRVAQTPMIYDVENHFSTFRAYAGQMRRWFVFPRQSLVPLMTGREQLITLVGSLGNLIPGVLAVMAPVTRRGAAVRSLAVTQVVSSAVYMLCEVLYLKRYTPLSRRWLVNIVGLLSPLQIVAALLSGDEVEWRGKRMRIKKGGDYEEADVA
ncbi:MAG: glycosyltransferase [Chloroflexota bacterium]